MEDGNPPQISVLAEHGGRFQLEILRNEPQDSPTGSVSTTPPGIVTMTAPDGRFIYKLRPASVTSVTFGRLPGAGDLEARISDRGVKIVVAGHVEARRAHLRAHPPRV